MDSSVVLPAPLGPSSPKIAPRSTASDTPRSAAVSRRRSQPERNVLVTSRASMARPVATAGDMIVDGNMRWMADSGGPSGYCGRSCLVAYQSSTTTRMRIGCSLARQRKP